MQKEWKDIIGYEGLYQISNYGDVKSLGRITVQKHKLDEIILKKSQDKDGYNIVTLYKNGKKKTHKVHRLVANAFLQKKEGLNSVNHKNEIKDDNRVSNLEWCDDKYNVNYGSRTEKAKKTMRKYWENPKNHLDRSLIFMGHSVSESTRKKISDKQKIKFSKQENRDKSSREAIDRSRPVIATNIETGEEISFKSINEAIRELGLEKVRTAVKDILHNKRKTTQGYTFRFK